MTFPSEQEIEKLAALSTLSGAKREVLKSIERMGYAKAVASLRHGEQHEAWGLCKRVKEIEQAHFWEVQGR